MWRREFGAALVRARTARGWSQAALARAIPISPGQLSRIENGRRGPGAALARRCDLLLETGGELERFVLRPPTTTVAAASDGEMAADWTLSLHADGSGTWSAGPALRGAFEVSPCGQRVDLDELQASQQSVRRALRSLTPVAAIPVLFGQLQSLRGLAHRARAADRQCLLAMGAGVADSLAHAVRESGDHGGALRWSSHAAGLAQQAGERDLDALCTAVRALMMVHVGAAGQAIALASDVRSDRGVAASVRWLAAHREAAAYALAGDEDRTLSALASAADLELSMAGVAPYVGEATNLPLTDLVRGWCLYDLGRVDESADVLDEAVASIPAESVRSRARFGVRRALAHAARGAVDRACEIMSDLVSDIERVDSATIRVDLRAFSRAVGRWHSRSVVVGLRPRLISALSGRSYG